MQALIDVYPLCGSTIPHALAKSIGNCKFFRRKAAGYNWPYNEMQQNGGRLNGAFSNLEIRLGTSQPNDTCVFTFMMIKKNEHYFIPWTLLFCDADGYVSLQKNQLSSGTSCIFNGANVKSGEISHGTEDFKST